MTVANPFLLAVSAMLLAAAAYEVWQGDWRLATFDLGVAVANFAIATRWG